MDLICALGPDRLHACLERLSPPCHLCIWEVEMSLLSEACYCCGERGQSAWPLNAQMTPRKKKEQKKGGHYFKRPTSNLSPGLISWLGQVMCRATYPR